MPPSPEPDGGWLGGELEVGARARTAGRTRVLGGQASRRAREAAQHGAGLSLDGRWTTRWSRQSLPASNSRRGRSTIEFSARSGGSTCGRQPPGLVE